MKRKQVPVLCDHCQKWFKSGAGLALHQRHTSGEWQRGGYSEAGLEARRASFAKVRAKSPSHRNVERVSLTCSCGKVFDVVPSAAKRRKYCSKSCLAKAQKGKRPPMGDEQRATISAKQKARYQNDPTSNPFYGRTPTNYRGWGHGGYCKELGFHVRSTWERDYLLALKEAGVEFEYEPKRYDLGSGKGTYMPDIRLGDKNVFVEITGWDKPGKEQKRALFQEVYGWPLYVIREKPTKANIAKFVAMCKVVMKSDDFLSIT